MPSSASPAPSNSQQLSPELSAPLSSLKGVGPKLAEKLADLGLQQIQDVLLHLPLRFEDRTRVVPLNALQAQQSCLTVGTVTNRQSMGFRRRGGAVVQLRDDSGASLRLCFFNYGGGVLKRLAVGDRVQCFGEVKAGLQGLEMVHPSWQKLAEGEAIATEASLSPIYPAAKGVSQAILRKLSEQALAMLAQASLPELLPPELCESRQLQTIDAALRVLHRPGASAEAQNFQQARHRLVYEELLAHRLSLRLLRQQARAIAAPVLNDERALAKTFRESLPFALTGAQSRVSKEIAAEIANEHAMLRLLQGDVGSGKTVVAAEAMFAAAGSGWQAALMAPTELLAEQHYRNLCRWAEPLQQTVVWLSGSQTREQRQRSLSAIAAGAPLIVGTHALLQAGVEYARLGLIVVDEQHRFGVEQRLQLRDKGASSGLRPHQLVMTATPIPRTMAMTSYADLDVSVIDELPAGRKGIETAVISQQRRPEVIERLYAQIHEGAQAYWVCPLVEDSEQLASESAQRSAEMLAEAMPDVRIGLAHGRLKAAEKEAVMRRFTDGEIDLLVATTVIEVGVDVPNARMMIIENAERMGLSQLHQLRGRVGRGDHAGFCVLLYRPPLNPVARERLETLRNTEDGFVISETDLRLRGPGELLGRRQTGDMRFRIADLNRDRGLLEAVAEDAELMLSQHPQQARKIVTRWLGHAAKYADA